MKRLIAIFLIIAASCSAQTARQVDFLINGVHDSNGAPVQGGKAYFYSAGHIGDSSFFKSTWADAYKLATNTNPITLSALGDAKVFGDGTYDIIVKTSDDLTLIQVLSGFYGASSSGNSNQASIEEYIFTVDRTDPTISLANPYNVGARQLQIFLDGVRQYPNQITELNSTRFRLSGYISASSSVQIYNLGSAGLIGDIPRIEEYKTASSTLTDQIFSLATATYTINSRGLHVWVDGIRQYPTEFYELSSASIQILGVLASGSEVMFEAIR